MEAGGQPRLAHRGADQAPAAPAVDLCRLRQDLSTPLSKAFETIYLARLAVFKLKFGLKFLISALQSTAVFVLLFAGGIMVLNGKTEIGISLARIPPGPRPL
jgi:hypothetical protein